jgi:hypothetical protein
VSTKSWVKTPILPKNRKEGRRREEEGEGDRRGVEGRGGERRRREEKGGGKERRGKEGGRKLDLINVLVIYFWVTNDHKFAGLRQHTFIIWQCL